MSRRSRNALAPGEDAFLDTVANLVGILIILVVVVGMRTRSSAELAERQAISETQSAEREALLRKGQQLESDLGRLIAQRLQYAEMSERQRIERQLWLDRNHSIEALLEQAEESLEAQDRLQLESDRRLSQLQQDKQRLEQRLAEIGEELEQLEDEEPEVIRLQHLPTPMAKTVFDQELHLLVERDRILVIPWDRLVDMLRHRAQQAAQRLGGSNRIDDSLGPIEGFMMHYRLVAKRGLVGGRSGTTSLAQVVELDKFELEPQATAMRQTLEQSLDTGGRLRIELAARDPRDAVVTVWVHPDGFATYRRLKDALFEEGFLTAARPLPEGVRVGASPRGSQSTAQ
jgi:hypothetical protein